MDFRRHLVINLVTAYNLILWVYLYSLVNLRRQTYREGRIYTTLYCIFTVLSANVIYLKSFSLLLFSCLFRLVLSIVCLDLYLFEVLVCLFFLENGTTNGAYN